MKIIKKVTEGEMLPQMYGIAWVEHQSGHAVCLPVPFNLVARAVRAAWLFLKLGGRQVPINPRAAYDQGRRDEREAHALRNIEFDQTGADYPPVGMRGIDY